MRANQAVTHPLTWVAMVGGVLLAAVMTFAYVGAFVNPIGQLEGLPIAYVNLDEPVEVAGTSIAVGDEVTQTIENPEPGATDQVRWVEYDTREAALEDIGENALAGAVVLPQALSQQVADIGTSIGAAPPAQIDVISNPGAGSIQPVVVDQAAEQLLTDVNAAVTDQLSQSIAAAGATVDPADVQSLAQPVVALATDFPELTDRGGRGLPPLYVAVMTTLAGLVGAIAIHVAVGAITGTERIEVFGRQLSVSRRTVTVRRRFADEVLVVLLLAIFSGPVIALVAIGVLDAQADQPWTVAWLCMLGVASIGWFTLACVTAFGIVGEILVVLVTTIFGVPSARGVYPAEALPSFFEALGRVLPLRYLTDALRSAFFFEGRAAAGLGAGVTALVIWALASLAAGVLVVLVIERNQRSEASDLADGEQLVEQPA